MRRKIQLMDEEVAKIKTGEDIRTDYKKEDVDGKRSGREVQGTMVTLVHHTQWLGGLGQEDGNDDGQCGCQKDPQRYSSKSARLTGEK